MAGRITGGVCVTVLFSAASLHAAITIDGSLADWSAAYVYTDAVGDGMIQNWGCFYQSQSQTDPGYLYWFMEADRDISLFVQPGSNDAWPGVWIDCDHYSGPITLTWVWRPPWQGTAADYVMVYQAPSAAAINLGWVKPEWQNGAHQGIDIEAELGINSLHWGEGYNYWGWNDAMGIQGNPINPGGSYDYTGIAWSGHVLEARIPLDSLISEVTSYPDYVHGNFKNGKVNGLWKAAMRSEGQVNGTWITLDCTYARYITLTADANNDGQTTLSDFTPISVNYLKTAMTWEEGDYNLDGTITLSDFAFLSVTFLANLYAMGPSGAVPEPLTLLLLTVGGLLVRRGRQKMDTI